MQFKDPKAKVNDDFSLIEVHTFDIAIFFKFSPTVLVYLDGLY